RVVPGWSATMLADFPESRLVSVLLPTLGRPATTTEAGTSSRLSGPLDRSSTLARHAGSSALPSARALAHSVGCSSSRPTARGLAQNDSAQSMCASSGLLASG